VNQKLMLPYNSVVALSFSPTIHAPSPRRGLRFARKGCAATALALSLWAGTAFAQSTTEAAPKASAPQKPASANGRELSPQESDPNSQPKAGRANATMAPTPHESDDDGKQSKRILWVFPNYRAVSVGTELPALSPKEKFRLATQDSFDYSAFISAGIIAGVSQASGSYPEFLQGGKGFGRYYWHAVADQTVGNYMTEAIVPSLTHEDPRYYTLGRGGFFKRSGYAVSRLLITRTDSGNRTINISEIVGNGAGAGISDTYYPSRERTWTKTGQKWLTQIALDGAFNILKEFWPDINQAIFHGKY
jgi:hypothetical protein